MPQLDPPILNLIAWSDTFIRMEIVGVPNGSHYELFRADNPSFTGESTIYIGVADFFEDSDVVVDDEWYYRAISVVNGSYTQSTYSNVISATVEPAEPLTPPPVFVIDYNYERVRFSVGSVEDGSLYRIQRSLSSTFTSPITVYEGISDLFEDVDINPATSYYYRAMSLANGNRGDSTYGPTIRINVPSVIRLEAPGIFVGLNRFDGTISIDDVAEAAFYTLERDIDSLFPNPVFVNVEDRTGYDVGLNPSTTYHYRAKAHSFPESDKAESLWSDVVSATTASYTSLSAPTLSASTVSSSVILLGIIGVSGGVSYSIFRDINSSFINPVNVYNGAQLSYNDSPLQPSTTYYYRAKANATENNAESGWSSIVSATTSNYVPPIPPVSPIPGLKYSMPFKDELGKDFEVRLHFKGYVGAITFLTGGPNPVIVNVSGSDDDQLEPNRDFKATINILVPYFEGNFYNDITSANDKDCWVEIVDVDDSFKYTGWLIADEHRRKFDETMFEISLTVVSPISVMKGTELVEADGKMMFGAESVADIVNQCLALSTHEDAAVEYQIFSSLKEASYLGSLDLFNQIRFFIEGFNDSNGRPPKCFDVLEKLCISCGFYWKWENNTLKFFDDYDTDRTAKVIRIKTLTDSTDFFTGNTEIITKSRASKEVSLKFNYGQATGLLRDGRFLQATGGMLDQWHYQNLRTIGATVADYITPRWSGNPTGTVERRGNGRNSNPFKVRLWGEISTEGKLFSLRDETYMQGLTAYTNRFYRFDKLNIKVRFKYFDWRTKYNRKAPSQINEQVPYLFLNVLAIPSDGNWNIVQNIEDVKNIEGTNLETGNTLSPPPYWTTPLPPRGQINPIQIAVESTLEVQSYELNIPWNKPANYDSLQVSILGMRWDKGKPVAISSDDLWLDVIDVIVSKETESSGYKTTGEEVFLTQIGNVTKIEETKDVFFGNFDNADISGSFLKNDNTISGGFTRGATTDKLQNWLVRSMMAQKRSPRHKIDCDFRSNNTRSSDLLQFKEGDDDLLPNKYMIGSFDYNVKHCEVKVTAFEVATEDKPYMVASETFEAATLTHDMLENYKIYS